MNFVINAVYAFWAANIVIVGELCNSVFAALSIVAEEARLYYEAYP